MARRKRSTNSNPFGLGGFDFGMDTFAKRQTLEGNRFRGRMAEEGFALDQTIQGRQVKRIHKGGDYIVQNTDMFGRNVGKPKTVEIKTGNSKLSVAQKRKKRQLGKNYKVVRY